MQRGEEGRRGERKRERERKKGKKQKRRVGGFYCGRSEVAFQSLNNPIIPQRGFLTIRRFLEANSSSFSFFFICE